MIVIIAATDIIDIVEDKIIACGEVGWILMMELFTIVIELFIDCGNSSHPWSMVFK